MKKCLRSIEVPEFFTVESLPFCPRLPLVISVTSVKFDGTYVTTYLPILKIPLVKHSVPKNGFTCLRSRAYFPSGRPSVAEYNKTNVKTSLPNQYVLRSAQKPKSIYGHRFENIGSRRANFFFFLANGKPT